MNVLLWLVHVLTMGPKTSSTSTIEKTSETFDNSSPTDFYGLFIDTSKPANKDGEAKVSRLSAGIAATMLTFSGQDDKAEAARLERGPAQRCPDPMGATVASCARGC